MLVKISFMNANGGVQEPSAIKTSKSRSEAAVANAKSFDEGKKDATPDEEDDDDALIDIKIKFFQQFTSLNTFLLCH